MEYRNLGRTGVKVSPLCLGTMNFGDRTEESDAIAIIDRALESGINFIDTANIYNHGISETIVGKALKSGGKRYNTVLATKFHGSMDQDPNNRGNSRRHIRQQCEASLKRLQTDCIDLYQVHRPQPEIPIDETLRALDDLIRAGKVHYIGTSTFAGWQLTDAIYIAKELGLNRFVCEQPPYHLLDRRIERELVPAAINFGVGLIPWSPLAGGFLTGKYKRGQERPADSRYHKSGNSWADRCFTDRGFDILEMVEKIAEEKSCSPSQIAIAWCAGQPGITSTIIGPRTIRQFEDNLGAGEIEITDLDQQRLDQISTPGHMVADFYEADFRPYLYP